MKARLIAAGLLGLWIGSTGIAGDIRAEHHIFLVDISGSMLKAKGATPSPIHVRQEVLRNWFKTNPSSSVTLISFNTDISSPQTFKLANANELAKALRWINELESNKRRGTHLWTCLSKTLHVSTDWIKQHPEDSVVHTFLLTD
jgi:von Willebrand factor type A domain